MLFDKETYTARRDRLKRQVKEGLILLFGNNDAPSNYPANVYKYRQDSSFLYFYGQHREGLVGVIDIDNHKEYLIGNDIDIEDIVWFGAVDSVADLAAQSGVEHSAPMSRLEELVTQARTQGRKIHFLPPYRHDQMIQLMDLTGIHPSRQREEASLELIMAVIDQRAVKTPAEIEEIERACAIGHEMHTTAMRMCRPGVVERQIAGAIEGVAKSQGQGVSFPSIVSQHGETLHNLHSDGVLQNGRLLLCDAGAEGLSYYCSDHTRTYPVSGKFTQKQKDIYNIVLAAHDRVAAMIAPHMPYMDIHNASYRILAEGLISLGLMRGTAEDAVAAGAMTLFMPHGLGHGMGLDVHDCEAIGERSFDFSEIAEQAAKSGTCIQRSTWRIEPGTVMTDEPGIYFIPALIDKCKAEGKYKGIVDYDALDAYRDFGGIRIEDDIIVTETGSRMIGGDKRIPITVDELEAVVGR